MTLFPVCRAAFPHVVELSRQVCSVMVSAGPGTLLDVDSLLQRESMDVIGRVGFGVEMGSIQRFKLPAGTPAGAAGMPAGVVPASAGTAGAPAGAAQVPREQCSGGPGAPEGKPGDWSGNSGGSTAGGGGGGSGRAGEGGRGSSASAPAPHSSSFASSHLDPDDLFELVRGGAEELIQRQVQPWRTPLRHVLPVSHLSNPSTASE